MLYVRQDLGSGRPLVLLHGMFADGTQWRVMADKLSKYYRVIVVDLLGHGKSPRPPDADYTPHEHAVALRKTLEHIGATEDATVVGYSMGGTVALQYAADYHDVAQLYMISAPFYLRPEDMVAAGYANSLFYTKLSVGLYHRVNKLLRPGKLVYKLVDSEKFMKGLHYLIDAYDNELNPEIMRKNLDRLINDYPFASNLAKVTAPITYFAGKRDVFVVHGQLAALKKIQPLMEIEMLGILKNDHMLVQYLPNKMVGILTRYNQELLHTTSSGKGEVLLLLHGIESSSVYWDNILPNLKSHYRVVAVELLGFGKSPKPLNVAYSLHDQVKWLERTLRSQGITEFHIMGHSLGALVSMAYAAAHPREVLSMTLLSPVIHDESQPAKKLVIKRLRFIEYFSGTSRLAAIISKTVGPKRLKPYIPAIRSVENAVKHQNFKKLAATVADIPTTILYGERDPLVDLQQLEAVASRLHKAKVVQIPQGFHNFSLTDPQATLKNLPLNIASEPKPPKSTVRPVKVFAQLAKLAIPILFAKGIFYAVVGLLLFSRYKEETLVVAVAAIVITQSVQFIKGAFSLKNEGLSYLSYVGIGIFGILAGYLLFHNFDLSLRLAVLVVSSLVLVNGITRLLAGIVWTTRQPLRRRQIISGAGLTLFAGAAFLGSSFSLQVIVYAFAAYFLVRGAVYLLYAWSTVVLSYIRSFSD